MTTTSTDITVKFTTTPYDNGLLNFYVVTVPKHHPACASIYDALADAGAPSPIFCDAKTSSDGLRTRPSLYLWDLPCGRGGWGRHAKDQAAAWRAVIDTAIG